MRPPLPPLDPLAAFEAAARHQSFARAGEELHLSASAVSHRVKALEAHLGHRLFHRRARTVHLTDRGRAYLPVVRELFDELARETTAIFDHGAEGRVTLRVPVSYGTRVLAPHLSGFTRDTDIRVDVLSAIWEGHTMELEIDLEIHLTPPPRSAEVLAREQALLVAHPETGDGALDQIVVVGYEDWTSRLEPHVELVPSPVVVDTWEAALAVVEATPHTCTLTPSAMAATSVAGGRAILAPSSPVSMRSAYWIEWASSDAAERPEVFAFVDWLRALHADLAPVAEPATVGPGGA